MNPAREPRRPRDAARLLVVDPGTGGFKDAYARELPRFLRRGDTLVVNDAATIPASLRGCAPSGSEIEVRLASQMDDALWQAVLFGSGDWAIPTELRDPPEVLEAGSKLWFNANLTAAVIEVSPKSTRLVTIRFDRSGADLWTALYAYGRPIQYSYLSRTMDLWAAQTIYASRPWAAEMPSAGESLSWQTLAALRRSGIRIVRLTHAAGLSATGDEELDAVLPLSERFDIPGVTVKLIDAAHGAGGRVVAVGTTVVRALEGCAAQNSGKLVEGTGTTDLIIGPQFSPKVVDGILTGVHEPSQSHFRLLRALASETSLRRALRHAGEVEYVSHEFGDACLILRGAL